MLKPFSLPNHFKLHSDLESETKSLRGEEEIYVARLQLLRNIFRTS